MERKRGDRHRKGRKNGRGEKKGAEGGKLGGRLLPAEKRRDGTFSSAERIVPTLEMR